MLNKKRVGIVIAVIILIAGAGGLLWYFWGQNMLTGGSSADKVYVESVKALIGSDAGVNNRYTGVVESQETWDVKKDEEKTVKELFVAQGDMVEKGTPLFEYDTEELKAQLAQAQLDLEEIGNETAGYQNQISELKNERGQAPESEKFQYTTQIQTLENSIKQSEFSKESKNIEIEKFEESIKNAVVVSKIAGIIRSVSENGFDPMTGEALPYISVLATGDYRVKGTVNEQNISQIIEGQPVIIRSRVDEEQTWTGTVTKVDTESQAEQGGNDYTDGSTADTATKYPFFIKLDGIEGLILGQHVFIEMDQGQTAEKEGIWLYESYLVREEEKAYVWAADGRSRLEKREVELGEYDEAMFQYEIKAGLTEKDLIALPMPGLYEGVATVTNMEEVDYNAPMYQEEGVTDGAIPEEGVIEDGMSEEEILPDGAAEEGIPEETIEEGMPEETIEEGIPEENIEEAIPEREVEDLKEGAPDIGGLDELEVLV